MKQCPACLKLGIGLKPESEFTVNRADKSGLDTYCKECKKAKFVAWMVGGKDSARKRAAYAINPEKERARFATYRAANPEKVIATNRAWAQANPVKVAAKAAHRRALVLQRTPIWASKEKIEDFYAQAQAAREFFPEVDWHVDHIAPLKGTKVSGLHVHDNLQVIPGIENLKKSNRSQIEFGKDMRDLVRAALAS